MFSKSQGRSLFTVSFILLFIYAVIFPLNSQGIASAKAQDSKLEFSHSPTSSIGYEFGDLPLIAQNAMVTAIESRSAGILTGGTFFVVGHYESSGMSGIGHIGAAVGVEQPDWDNSVWFIINLEDPAQVALEGTPIFNDFFSALPKALQDKISPASNNEVNAEATVFLFPWDKSQQWRYTYGWHGSTNLTLDFAPYNVAPSDMWVLASAGGTITLVCSDPYQAAINLTTANGVMTYRHIDYNSFTGQNVKDTVVNQGRKLALLYNGSQGSGYYDTSQNYPWPSCVQGSSPSCIYIKFNTYCGAGTGAHNHWTLPAKPFTVDGWQVGNDAIWRKSGQADKGLYSYFNSTNPLALVNSISRTDTNPSNASSVNFTVTFSENVTGVDTVDFNLTTSGVSGAAVSGVSGTGSVYTVTVYTGNGDGTIRLDVTDNNSIVDASTNPLGGAALGDGNFTTGQVYTIDKPTGDGADTAGVFRPGNGALYMKNANTTGFADYVLTYGLPGDYPVVGDWDGNGTSTLGIYRDGNFYLRNSNTNGFADLVIAFGAAGDQPVAGDWDGDGTDTIGIYRSSIGTFFLRNTNTSGEPDISFSLGVSGDVGIAGDWNGDGTDTTGVFRPSNGALYLKNANTTGFADLFLTYGLPGDKPITGDWNNDGIDTIGVYRNGGFYLRNSNTNGYAEINLALGIDGDMPIAGDWDGLP